MIQAVTDKIYALWFASAPAQPPTGAGSPDTVSDSASKTNLLAGSGVKVTLSQEGQSAAAATHGADGMKLLAQKSEQAVKESKRSWFDRLDDRLNELPEASRAAVKMLIERHRQLGDKINALSARVQDAINVTQQGNERQQLDEAWTVASRLSDTNAKLAIAAFEGFDHLHISPDSDYGSVYQRLNDTVALISGSKASAPEMLAKQQKSSIEMYEMARLTINMVRANSKHAGLHAAQATEPGPVNVVVQPGLSLSRIIAVHPVMAATYCQHLVAVLQANPDAFIENNMNLVRAGAKLTLPDAATVRAVNPAEARRVYQEQLEAHAVHCVRHGLESRVTGGPFGAARPPA